jgi:hypothetical protein
MYSEVDTMASQVISFRVPTETALELRKRAKPGESDSQTAQRLLNKLLGTTKEVEVTEVDSRIQEALKPLRAELDEIKAVLAQLPGKQKRVI